MRLSEKLKNDAEHIWRKIYDHPFVNELYEGILPAKKFRFYILQDYNYLIASIRNFVLLASRAENEELMMELLDIAYIESTGEFKGYKNFLKEINLSIEEARKQKQTQVAISYVNFLLSTSSLKSFEEGITAVLPCYWSYEEIAKIHEQKLTRNKNKIYREWAHYYLDDDYLDLVNRLRKLVDEIRDDFPYSKLKDVFIASSRFEYMFWDSVYREEKGKFGD